MSQYSPKESEMAPAPMLVVLQEDQANKYPEDVDKYHAGSVLMGQLL